MANDNLSTAIANTPAAAIARPPESESKLTEAWRMADRFANSQLVPKHMQGKRDDCFIAIVMAEQLGENALMVMQNIVIVQGTAGWKATFVIGRANRLGPFAGPIEFRTEGKGDSLSATAYATVKATGKVVERRVDMAMAKAAGWSKNVKYQEIPEQMLSYRAACFLVRLYCPEVLLGMHTDDELHDIRASGPGPSTPSGAIAAINEVIVSRVEPTSEISDADRDELERIDRGGDK